MSKVGHERSTVVLGTRGSKLAVQQSEWVQGTVARAGSACDGDVAEDPNIGRQDS